MDWSIHHLEEDGVIFAKTQGYATWERHKIFTKSVLETGHQNNLRIFLLDHRDLELGLSTLEIDDLPDILREIGMTAEDRTAILYNPAAPHSSDYKFLENVSRLASLQLKIFPDKEEALAWLKKQSQSPFRPQGS